MDSFVIANDKRINDNIAMTHCNFFIFFSQFANIFKSPHLNSVLMQ